MADPHTMNPHKPREDPTREQGHWGVDVRVDGERILTIESNCLSGKSDLSDRDLAIIRQAAKHLLAFAGSEEL